MVKAVIFDIDGTQLNSVDFHAPAWQEIVHQYARDGSFEEIRSQMEKGEKARRSKRASRIVQEEISVAS